MESFLAAAGRVADRRATEEDLVGNLEGGERSSEQLRELQTVARSAASGGPRSEAVNLQIDLNHRLTQDF
jgi:hypothetical protein